MFAGLLVGVIALSGYGFVSWYAGQVRSLSKTADYAASKRVSKVANLARGTAPAQPAANEPKLVSPNEAFAPSRITAPATMQLGPLAVGVASADLGPLQLRSRRTGPTCLSVTLRITNLGGKPVEYRSWSHTKSVVTLTDRLRNYYNRLTLAPEDPPVGGVSSATIEPGLTITDVLVFEAPLNVTEMDLDLPVDNSAEPYSFRIPVHMIRTVPAAMAGLAPPPILEQLPQAPVSPERDPQIQAAVLSDYRAAKRNVDRKAKGMSYDRGRQYRRASQDSILEELAEKYNLTTDLIRSIVGL